MSNVLTEIKKLLGMQIQLEQMTLDEVNSLMDGVEIARNSLDHIIAYLIRQSFNEDGDL